MPQATITVGDCRTVLDAMPEASVHCCVTSPPYWGLRDYGADGQIGLEDDVAAWVATMVDVFRSVRRVLRNDGTVWLNLGDTFADKQLLGQPWRLAFALQADGWYLRSEIIWSKCNPMPESATDRPTKSHETIFLLSKAPRYFYDADAVREAHAPKSLTHRGGGAMAGSAASQDANGQVASGNWAASNGVRQIDPRGRNLRDVWTIATHSFPDAHFATFPPKLVEPCVKAGTSEHGVCPECGAPWERVVDRAFRPQENLSAANGLRGHKGQKPMDPSSSWEGTPRGTTYTTTTGWRPTCDHDATPVPATVLDPFTGSGTTGLVATGLGRDFIGAELNPEYAAMARKRIKAGNPLYVTVA